MKGAWRETLTDFKLQNLRLSTVPKDMFSSLLKKSLNKMDTVTARVVKPNENNQIQFETSKLESAIKRNLINSFRSTGIHPADREQVFKKLPPEQVADPTPIVENALTGVLNEQRFGDAVPPQRKRTRLEVQPGCSISTAAYGQESDDDEDGELGIEDRLASVSSICDVGEEEANSEDFEVGQFILGTFYSQRGKKTYKYVYLSNTYAIPTHDTFDEEFFEQIQREIWTFTREHPGQPGPDSINRKTMKQLPNTIYPILALLMNACLKFAYFPKAWKCANTVMIPKPDKDPTKLDSYRPISLINVPGELFELILKSRIIEHFEIENIIPPYQHGFRAEHSTQNALVGLTTDITKHINTGQCTVAIFLDIQKAFDKTNNFIHWKQKISSEGRDCTVRSPPHTPQAGVPQGSILSPILFSLYVSDIPKTHEIIQYADDTVLYVSAPNTTILNRRAQNMLDEFSNWCNIWRVRLNPNKTQTILFKHPNNSQKPSLKSNEINLTLSGERLELQDEVSYLGVTFTRTLNWQTDLNKTLTRVRQRASILRSLGGHFGRCHPQTPL
ncbi:hypothetical protein JTB14_008316 [Gonioctena quinquepunctata]|nr:hypothetical protein JTB14_008316 [Gonioctena quinquepunctata]